MPLWAARWTAWCIRAKSTKLQLDTLVRGCDELLQVSPAICSLLQFTETGQDMGEVVALPLCRAGLLEPCHLKLTCDVPFAFVRPLAVRISAEVPVVLHEALSRPKRIVDSGSVLVRVYSGQSISLYCVWKP